MASLFLVALTRSVTLFNFCGTASQNLHDSMFRGLISTKMRFFDTNPSGRIMNRFSKDMGCTDEALPKSCFDATQINLAMIGAISVTIFTNVKFSIVILIMGMIFLVTRRIYLKSSTNIKRFEGTSKQSHSMLSNRGVGFNQNVILFAAKSPIFSHISATLSGLSTIRAFQAQELLRQEFDDHQDLNTGAWFMFVGVLNSVFSTAFFGMIINVWIFFLEI